MGFLEKYEAIVTVCKEGLIGVPYHYFIPSTIPDKWNLLNFALYCVRINTRGLILLQNVTFQDEVSSKSKLSKISSTKTSKMKKFTSLY